MVAEVAPLYCNGKRACVVEYGERRAARQIAPIKRHQAGCREEEISSHREAKSAERYFIRYYSSNEKSRIHGNNIRAYARDEAVALFCGHPCVMA